MKFISILSLFFIAHASFGCAATHRDPDTSWRHRALQYASPPAYQGPAAEAVVEEAVPPQEKTSVKPQEFDDLMIAVIDNYAGVDGAEDTEAAEKAEPLDRGVQAVRVVGIAYDAPTGWTELDKDDRGLNVVAVFDDGSGARIIMRYETVGDMKSVVSERLKRHELPGCVEMHGSYNEEGDMAMGYRLCGERYTTATMFSLGGETYTVTGVFPESMYAAGNRAIRQLVSSLRLDTVNWSTASGQTAKPGAGPVD